MYKTLLCILSFCIHVPLAAQDIIPDTIWNQTDEFGRKQGFWKKYYPDSTLMYKGFFKDNKPLGFFYRFFEGGNKKAVLNHLPDGISSYGKFYYQNGTLAAEGKYVYQKKDSIWNYYSYYTQTLSYLETYSNGMKNGVSKKYYDNGQEAEVLFWKDDLEHGLWQQFYEDSTLRLTSDYQNGKINGSYKVFSREGILLISGKYIQDVLDGTWTYNDEEGNLEFELIYDNGVLLNEKVLEEKVKEFVEELEKNLGTIPEPDLMNIAPQQNK